MHLVLLYVPTFDHLEQFRKFLDAVPFIAPFSFLLLHVCVFSIYCFLLLRLDLYFYNKIVARCSSNTFPTCSRCPHHSCPSIHLKYDSSKFA